MVKDKAPKDGDADAPTATLLREEFSTFAGFQSILDPRLLRALALQGFSHPTPVQQAVIPLSLQGNDILARARTGSGKTLAYALPVLHRILSAKKALPPSDPARRATRALFLVPTRELAEQVTATLTTLLQQSAIASAGNSSGSSSTPSSSSTIDDVFVVNLARDASSSVHRLLLADRPDAVVSTPARAVKFLKSSSSSKSGATAVLDVSRLESLVIDEADLILSYGHDSDLRTLLAAPGFSRTYQSFLMSATMTKDVGILKELVMRKATIVNLPDHQAVTVQAGAGNANTHPLSQFYVYLSEVDKFLLLFVILKLRLIRGKAIIFVNDTERCYRVKLFLEQFGLRACALNRELPINSRYHIVQEFNKGVYDYIIATDEPQRQFEQAEDAADQQEEDDDEEEAGEDEAEEEDQVGSKKRKRTAGEADVKQQKRSKLSVQGADGEDGEGEGSDDDFWESGSDDANAEEDAEEGSSKDDKLSKKSKKKRQEQQAQRKAKERRKNKDSGAAEYGVSRGIDFVNVACVINFDLPTSHTAYTHRVGRTARAGKTGTALSFVVPRAVWDKAHDPANTGPDSHWRAVGSASAREDERVWKRILKRERANAGVPAVPLGVGGKGVAGADGQGQGGPREWSYDKAQVEGFRYRMEDALRSVTKSGIREARIKELKEEILNSEKLKAYFEDNPRDLAYLRHDKTLHPARIQPHMKHIPGYLMPKLVAARDRGNSLNGAASDSKSGVLRDERGRNLGFVGFHKTQGQRGRGRGRGGEAATSCGGRGGRVGGSSTRGGAKRVDPLKKFK